MASAWTSTGFVVLGITNPVFVQVAPPFVLLNIPASLVPAYTVLFVGIVGSTAKAVMLGLVRPALLAVQVVAPSVLRNAPPPGVAWKAFAVVGKSPDVVVPVT